MRKLNEFIKRYALFILVCFVPLLVDAASWGTLSPGAVKSGSHAWWDVFDCTTNKTGPFTFEVVSTPYYNKKSYYRSVKITVDDYVPETINNITTTCTYYDVLQGDANLDSGRITRRSTVTYTYSIAAGGTPTTATSEKNYYIYRDQTIDLADKLGIRSIESMTYVTGSQYNTVGYSGCAAGSSACSITFAQGTANHNRAHVFKIKYVNTAGKTYETTVNVYEQSNTRTDSIGVLEPGEYTYSIYDENTSNFTCSKVSDGPYEVDKDIAANGTSGRIKVTSTNYSVNEYSNMKAKCTYNKDGVTHTIYYIFNLLGSSATVKDYSYTANGGETFNLWSSLNMKQIVSSNADFGSNATITGCSVGSTSCSVKMKDAVTDGRSTSSTIIYYDKSNVLTQSTITINEQVLSINKHLGTIGINNTVSSNIPASGVTCTTNSTGPFTKKLETKDGGYVLSVTNNNASVNTYNNLLITCEGTPVGVGGKTYKYNFTFDLDNQTTPIRSTKSYELFLGESLNFSNLFPIKKMYKNIDYTTGKTSGVMDITGCQKNDAACKVSLVGPNIEHDRNHKMVISYINSLDILYEVTVNVVEKDINRTTKAYPGLLGFCDFNSDWTFAQWHDSSGKKYSYYEAEVRGAVLPKCSADTSSGVLLEFKGWTKGYKAGDALTTKSSCGTDLLQPGQPTSFGQNYAPCYELKPHVRLTVNGGKIEDGSGFEFNPKDMTYIATGSSVNQEIKLPEVKYSGFYSTSKLELWRNVDTGATKRPGEKVKLDGSVWSAVSSRTVQQVDLYKTIGLNEVELFTVSGMASCSLEAGGSSYLSANYRYGDCEVKGLAVTPTDVYANVKVVLNDGTIRLYKFNVEDRASISEDDNGIFNVDTDENIIIGKNDDSTLNDFNTDQCENFFISRSGDSKFYPKYEKYTFAKYNGEDMNTGIYSVYQLCPTDMSTYVGLCLDPGRRGPNESGTGTHNRTFDFKGSSVNVNGNEYVKTDDIQKNGEFGKLVMYIVKNEHIDTFYQNSGDALWRRAASHVAVRSMAIVTGFSAVPDPSDEVYASHYYPYMGVANAIRAGLDSGDNDVSLQEATNAIENGTGSYKFSDWVPAVKSEVIKILAEYGGSDITGPTDGFERTIDDTVLEDTPNGKGYTINYKGTITAPTGATAQLTECDNDVADDYGVQCKVNNNGWKEISNVSNRRTYQYDVTVTVPLSSAVIPPKTVQDEKNLSFKITYSGGHDLVNAFIASPVNGSDNVQRMLIISTSNPMVYVYFSVVPNTCDMPILDPAKCPDEATCLENKNKGEFNQDLFKAAGCCKYILNENSYIFKQICSAECTSSTMTSVCDYTDQGNEKADFYEINEGSKYDAVNDNYKDAIGTCVVNVTDYYKNDNANYVDNIANSQNFIKYDDGENLINVESYKDNRYCQVTCEEDWEFSMDSFGNFIGENAVAAGTYFQIVNNDMFIGAKRTCYTTFINYDRFMTNIVDISNKLVDSYNSYSRWSHVWTDIDRQVKNNTETVADPDVAANNAKYFDHKDNGIKCVEYFEECPQGDGVTSTSDSYYWSAGAPGTRKCRMVQDYYDGSDPVCDAAPASSWDDHEDSDPVYTATGTAANSDSTECKFLRTYCDGGHNQKVGDKETLTVDNECSYKDYKTRSTTPKVKDEYTRPTGTCTPVTPAGGTTPSLMAAACTCDAGYTKSGSICRKTDCDAGYTKSGTKCYRYICPTGYTEVDGVCYNNTCPTGYKYSYDSKECYKYSYTTSHTENVYSKPTYKTETLKCKTWGKSYNYTLKTENDVKVENKDGKDVYYDTEEYDNKKGTYDGVYEDRDSISGTDLPDQNRQNKQKEDGNVMGAYAKEYTHTCSITAAAYEPGAKGSSECHQEGIVKEKIDPSKYGKTNEMFCEDDEFADLMGSDRDQAFCYAGGGESYTDTNDDADQVDEDKSNDGEAFKWVSEKFMDHSKKELEKARTEMVSYNAQIYSHAKDVFECQNFQLHNRTDDSITGRENNDVLEDTIMGMKNSYVKINTDYDPTGSYTYDEDFFMERVDKDNVLIQYTEKNNKVFKDASKNEYGKETNVQVDATINTPAGEVDTKLSRNYIEAYYYNPIVPWQNSARTGDASDQAAIDRVDNYEDNAYLVGKREGDSISNPARAQKKVVLCSVGMVDNGTGYATGKDGAVIPFDDKNYTSEWLGGICYQVTVDYKKVHYVKSSISNSSYYKNKGNWYVRGGDSKIHGDDISNAISKFNRIQPRGYVEDYRNDSEEYKRWSRLGSFNVFPISMATPRNLYQYTYTFGNIGSYYDGKLGRIMGSEKSIIQNNTRTCFYEVFEEVCLCCGYKIEPGDLVEQSGYGNYFGYTGSDPSKAGGDTKGTISYYTNSVSLGDIDLGRDTSLGTNWSDKSPFMYNGDDSLKTDKGHKLKENIETNGEKIYSSSPEYAYFLTPDTLKQIRSYNDANGYDLNMDRLKVYNVSVIACSSEFSDSECKSTVSNSKDQADVMNFQHYGSKFLIGEIDGSINLNSYGSIKNNYTNICKVDDSTYDKDFDMAGLMKSGNCRWVDYIETDSNNKTYDMVAEEYVSKFRLAFK